MPNLIQQINSNIDLIDRRTVEILPHRQRELILAHFPLLSLPRHGRRRSSYTGIREQRAVVRRVEGGRCLHLVRVAVGL